VCIHVSIFVPKRQVLYPFLQFKATVIEYVHNL